MHYEEADKIETITNKINEIAPDRVDKAFYWARKMFLKDKSDERHFSDFYNDELKKIESEGR